MTSGHKPAQLHFIIREEILIKALPSAALAASLLLAACGGGTDTADQGPNAASIAALTATAARQTVGTTRKQALAADAFSTELSAKLFALAESTYAAYFPSKQTTRNFEGWAYRFYPETGIYLAVIGTGVYVLGGTFGTEVMRLGEITQFVGPTPTGKDRPLTAAILGECPNVTASSSPNFYECMTGHLSGTQTFNTAKTCRLEVTADGVLTLSSDSKSGSVGPGFSFVSFHKNSVGTFILSATGTGSGAARLVINSNPTISFSEGGSLGADFTPAGSNTASISCKLNVPK